MIGSVCGPIGEVDAVADRRVPGAPDPDDPAVLDADVRLHDADDRVDDERAGDDDVELRRAAARPWVERGRMVLA